MSVCLVSLTCLLILFKKLSKKCFYTSHLYYPGSKPLFPNIYGACPPDGLLTPLPREPSSSCVKSKSCVQSSCFCHMDSHSSPPEFSLKVFSLHFHFPLQFHLLPHNWTLVPIAALPLPMPFCPHHPASASSPCPRAWRASLLGVRGCVSHPHRPMQTFPLSLSSCLQLGVSPRTRSAYD